MILPAQSTDIKAHTENYNGAIAPSSKKHMLIESGSTKLQNESMKIAPFK
jgi:hypothetical protein